MSKVRTRYAPSPTGIPHIGNIRTALFNYLFAKNQKGEFILRIEDTDQKRSTKEHILTIRESLEALGLKRDKEFIQSERLGIYKKHLEILKEKKIVYQDQKAWRFKVDTDTSQIQWNDLVHGEVSFPVKVIEDFIIMKSDGFPTYHMASVVDDHLMNITHIMRGDEWISSTPKHLLLYKAFGWTPPLFAHLPPILGPNKKKLSKREGAKSVNEYINEGYLPEALTNYLALLGWAPKGDREIFSLRQLINEFSIDRINKNSPIFNIEKLNWFNGQWIRKLTDADLASRIKDHFKKYDQEKVREFTPLIKDRLQTLNDFAQLAGSLIEEKIQVDPNKVILNSSQLSKFTEKYKNITEWTKTNTNSATVSVMESEHLTKREALGSIGMAISGSSITPPLFDTLEKLGKEKTIERLENVIKKKK